MKYLCNETRHPWIGMRWKKIAKVIDIQGIELTLAWPRTKRYPVDSSVITWWTNPLKDFEINLSSPSSLVPNLQQINNIQLTIDKPKKYQQLSLFDNSSSSNG